MKQAWKEIAPDVWLKAFPLNLMGTRIGRNVTAFALEGGKVLVHSTAFFDEADAVFLRGLGSHIHFMDTTCFHDTCTRQAMQAIPEASFHAPEGFPLQGEHLKPLTELEPVLGDSLRMMPIHGMPKVNEVEIYDPRNRLLAVSDLLFNFPPDTDAWTRNFFRFVAGIKTYPGISRFFRFMIKDRPAFQASVDRLRALDFDHLLVAHGQPVRDTGKAALDDALRRHGF